MTLPTPFSQSFWVDGTVNPNGIFVHSIDLCFAFKDDALALTLQLRPVTSGYPDPSTVYHNAQVTLTPDFITTVDGGDTLPNLSDATTYTRFTFPAPVYLPPGEHAMVFQTASTMYFIFMATLQDPILGSGRAASAQPYVGNLFRSQNSDAWQPYPSESVMFRVNRCVFNTSTPSTVEFDVIAPLTTSNVRMDTFLLSVNDVVPSATSINYNYESTDNTSGALAATASTIQPNRNYYPSNRQVLTTTNGSFKVFSTMASLSDSVSPVLDPTRINVIAVENIINNGELSNSLVTITNGGVYNFAGGNGTVTGTVSAPDASGGTQATMAFTITNNVMSNAVFTSVGNGYFSTPTVTIAAASPAATTNAAVSITGESSNGGGNALFRYVTRHIVLADGFDATDLVVYLTANKQVGTNIQVYYKVLSAYDSDQNFANKPYVRMTLATNATTFSQTPNDTFEYKYISPAAATIPPVNITYTSGGSTFTNFRVFAIKICGFSSSTTTVPVILNMRGIALA